MRHAIEYIRLTAYPGYWLARCTCGFHIRDTEAHVHQEAEKHLEDMGYPPEGAT